MTTPAGPCILLSRRGFVGAALAAGASAHISTPVAAEPARRKSKFNRVLSVGDPAPEFEGLLGIDGKRHSLSDLAEARAAVIIFIRNLCPTTHAYEARLIELARSRRDTGVEFVAISVSRNPAEGLDRMAIRARGKGYPWPYLLDESQFTGRSYGATVTPQIFALDGQRRIAYMGACDDNAIADKVEQRFLAQALDAILRNETPETTETRPRGCDIEYVE